MPVPRTRIAERQSTGTHTQCSLDFCCSDMRYPDRLASTYASERQGERSEPGVSETEQEHHPNAGGAHTPNGVRALTPCRHLQDEQVRNERRRRCPWTGWSADAVQTGCRIKRPSLETVLDRVGVETVDAANGCRNAECRSSADLERMVAEITIRVEGRLVELGRTRAGQFAHCSEMACNACMFAT